MLSSLKDKEAFVTDLLNKGHTVREIAKQAHVSFTYIKEIKMKITGDAKENQNVDAKNKQPLSSPSQAFKLFLGGRSIVEVAIELDLPTEQILKIHSDYLTLQRRQAVVSILDENPNNCTLFLKVFQYLKKNNISLKDFKDKIDIKENINDMKMERDELELEIFNLKESLKYHKMETNKIKNKCYSIKY